MKNYISVSEASVLTGASKDAIRRWLGEGRIPGAQKIVAVWLVPKKWAEAYVPRENITALAAQEGVSRQTIYSRRKKEVKK